MSRTKKWGHGKRRRQHDEREQDASLMGVGETLARVKNDSASATKDDQVYEDDDSGDWQTAESKRAKKRRRHEEHNHPSISHSASSRLQSFVKVGDLQNLALYLLADGTAPQWCAVRHHHDFNKVVVLMVPGLESGMFNGEIPLSDPNAVAMQDAEATVKEQDAPEATVPMRISPDDYYPVRLKKDNLPEPLQPLADIFEHLWPIKTPGDDKYGKMFSPLAAMLSTPITKPKDDRKTKGPQLPTETSSWQNKRVSITDLLATTDQLLEDGYVLHPAHYAGTPNEAKEAASRVAAKKSSTDGWVDTPNIPNLSAGRAPEQDIEKGSVTAGRKVLTLDCEMCLVSPPGESQVFRLTRATVIDWNGDVVLDRLVKPAKPITDYLTPYSGITAEKLKDVTTTLADIQEELMQLITPQTILVGHSLNSDLNALQITHPFIVDTTMLYPHPRGAPLRSSLKWLSQKFLSREIQKGHGSTGHDSVEDARATLDLVKQKCEKGKSWGTPDAHNESIFTRLSRHNRPPRDKADPAGADEPRASAVIDWGEPTRGYGSAATTAIGCESDAEVVAGIRLALDGSSLDDVSQTRPATVPPGGCDFIWGRFRELEAQRGWWNRTKALDTEALRQRTTSAAHVDTIPLATLLAQTTAHISAVYAALPPRSVLIVYSGSGDPRPLSKMQDLQRTFKEEYRTKKWDQLSVKWTDDEEQKLRRACETARRGIGMIAVKS